MRSRSPSVQAGRWLLSRQTLTRNLAVRWFSRSSVVVTSPSKGLSWIENLMFLALVPFSENLKSKAAASTPSVLCIRRHHVSKRFTWESVSLITSKSLKSLSALVDLVNWARDVGRKSMIAQSCLSLSDAYSERGKVSWTSKRSEL